MKKSFILVLLGIILFSGIASAYSGYFPTVREGMNSVVNSLIDIFEPILGPLFGGQTWSSDLLFERTLVFILFVAIIYIVLGRVSLFEDQQTVKWIVTIVVPLMGMRFMDYSQLVSIMQQYALISIIMMAVIPFLLYFYFVHVVGEDYDVFRKILWIFFVTMYIGLWSSASNKGTMAEVYFWTFIAGILCLIFDSKIAEKRRYFKALKESRDHSKVAIGKVNEQIREIQEMIRNGSMSRKDGEKAITDLVKHRNWIVKNS